jgi:hypothetical protein
MAIRHDIDMPDGFRQASLWVQIAVLIGLFSFVEFGFCALGIVKKEFCTKPTQIDWKIRFRIVWNIAAIRAYNKKNVQFTVAAKTHKAAWQIFEHSLPRYVGDDTD